ncbi:MAG: diacylglycerol kinase family lipid kinase [Candidatus Obscuribacterales bacterium]|nr:diacylglycerol kinase family lipid kinase [Candidatus Obscuribacterales bacterium]
MKKRRRALLVYNPESGAAMDRTAWLGHIVDKFCKELNYEVAVHATHHGITSQEIVDNGGHGFDLIVGAGGDGTIRLVLGALADACSEVPVAIIPFGTGNQLARNLGIYEENLLIDPVEAALEAIVRGRSRKIDIGKMNGHPFCVGVGAGPLADAVAAPSKEDKANWGIMAYVGSMVQTIATPPVELTVTADGDRFNVKASGVFVTNVGNLGIATVSEKAELDDGLLDLFIITLGELNDYVTLGFRFATSFLGGEAPYYLKKVSRVSIASRHPLAANVDGDFIGTTPMKVEVVPRAVRVICA